VPKTLFRPRDHPDLRAEPSSDAPRGSLRKTERLIVPNNLNGVIELAPLLRVEPAELEDEDSRLNQKKPGGASGLPCINPARNGYDVDCRRAPQPRQRVPADTIRDETEPPAQEPRIGFPAARCGGATQRQIIPPRHSPHPTFPAADKSSRRGNERRTEAAGQGGRRPWGTDPKGRRPGARSPPSQRAGGNRLVRGSLAIGRRRRHQRP
jgi:hypothetical protein